MRFRNFLSALAVTALAASSAEATNGYFVHGYGTHYKAMAGAGVALPMSSLAAATNPAAMVFVGKRYDFGLAIFSPNRGYAVSGVPSGFPGTFGLAPGAVDSGSSIFPVPNFGANWALGSRSTFGVALYGQGGMNTDYDSPTFGFAPTGVDLSQMFVAPTYAIEIADDHAVGFTGILAYQRFRAQGLQAFGPFSSDALNLSDNGYDSGLGFGGRFGYLGKLTPYLSLGASYQTRTNMQELEKYQGLFAEKGGFDIPSNWVVGVAVNPAERWTVAFDVHHMNYSEIPSVRNPMLPNLATSQLGMEDGAGFGWRDVTAYKLGVQWKSSGKWTWRGGYSYADQPIPSTETLFNILAPGVMRHHATFGFSYDVGRGKAINFSIMRAFQSTVRGPNTLEAAGAQSIELRMDQWDFELGYSFGFGR
jgi:long-chain fatty acid transport protein